MRCNGGRLRRQHVDGGAHPIGATDHASRCRLAVGRHLDGPGRAAPKRDRRRAQSSPPPPVEEAAAAAMRDGIQNAAGPRGRADREAPDRRRPARPASGTTSRIARQAPRLAGLVVHGGHRRRQLGHRVGGECGSRRCVAKSSMRRPWPLPPRTRQPIRDPIAPLRGGRYARAGHAIGRTRTRPRAACTPSSAPWSGRRTNDPVRSGRRQHLERDLGQHRRMCRGCRSSNLHRSSPVTFFSTRPPDRIVVAGFR